MDRAVTRKLTTILAADVEGYSRLMAADEVATLRALRACRAVFGRLIERHGGRIVNTAGDGLLADFPSVVEAVLCAVEVQRELAAQNGAAAAASPMRYRIGIHLGDVMVDGGDLFGEGVNLAARLQSLADPGGILISEPVYQQVRSKVAIGFSYLGERRPKNFPEDVPVYGLVLDGETETPPPPRAAVRRDRAGPPRGRPRHRRRLVGPMAGARHGAGLKPRGRPAARRGLAHGPAAARRGDRPRARGDQCAELVGLSVGAVADRRDHRADLAARGVAWPRRG
jgi:class 3 adenylate cyclase